MRHIVWLAGCLLVLSCTVNNDNLNADAGSGGSGGCPRCVGTGGASATGGQIGTGGASATGGRVGTGGASATGGQVGTGGQIGTGGQTATGGQPGTGGSATGGAGGSGGSGGQGGGKSCDGLETDYDNALTAAKRCTLGATNQCQQLVNSSLSCAGCKQYVNDTTMLSAIQTEWDNQNCSSAPHVCPEIACVVPTTSVCTSSPTSGDPGGGADPTGTCSPGPLTSAN
jgi:hypothetical protein